MLAGGPKAGVGRHNNNLSRVVDGFMCRRYVTGQSRKFI